MNNIKKYLEVFLIFLKIGSFTFGGGLAMLPLIQHEVSVKKKWISEEEVLDIFAISQSVPGVISINSAIFIGNKAFGLPGAVLAALGLILPAFISILLIITLLSSFQDNIHLSKFFAGITSASAGLIILTVIKSAKSTIKGTLGYIIAAAAFGMVAFFNIHAAWVILFGAAAGYFSYLHGKKSTIHGQYLLLFLVFLMIGSFSFGGGYAMLPMINQEIQRFGFMPLKEFQDIVALSQMTPGPIAVNAATYVGYKSSGLLGAVVATAGVSLPSFAIILLISAFLNKFKSNKSIQAILQGIRPATVGLIGSAALVFSRSSIMNEKIAGFDILRYPLNFINFPALAICIITIVGAWKLKIGPITLTFFSGILGVFILYPVK